MIFTGHLTRRAKFTVSKYPSPGAYSGRQPRTRPIFTPPRSQNHGMLMSHEVIPSDRPATAIV